MNRYKIEWNVYGTTHIDAETRNDAIKIAGEMTMSEFVDRSGALVYGPDYSIEKVNRNISDLD